MPKFTYREPEGYFSKETLEEVFGEELKKKREAQKKEAQKKASKPAAKKTTAKKK